MQLDFLSFTEEHFSQFFLQNILGKSKAEYDLGLFSRVFTHEMPFLNRMIKG